MKKKLKSKRVQEYKSLGFLLLYSFTLVLFYISPAQADHTLLHTAATNLPVGQWTQLTGTNAGLLSTQWGNGHGYDDGNMAWNSHSRKIFHTSADHGVYNGCPDVDTDGKLFPYPEYPGTCWKPLSFYDDATNTWSLTAIGGPTMPKYPNGNPVNGGHGMDQVAWDDVNEVMYIEEYYTGNFYRYCVNNTPNWCNGRQGVWTQFQLPGQPITQSAQGLAYFPGLDGGVLLFFWGDGSGFGSNHGVLYKYKESNTIGGTGTWTVIAGGKGELTNGDYNVMAECSPTKNVCIFGGGTGNATGSNAKHVYKIDASGTVTQMPNSPWDIGFATIDTRQLLADPVSGDFISLFGHSSDGGATTTSAELWRLNPDGAGAWTLLESGLQASGKPCGGPAPTYNKPCPNDFFGTAISTYGVLLYWRFTGASTAEVWLYKVGAGSGDTSPPVVAVTAPGAGATVSGASVTLSATASDNVGVSGVQFRVDGANIGSEDTSSPYSITWNSTTVANGTRSITAVARDAANNITTSNPVTVTVANAAGGGADFATRCNAAGVLRCVGFDNASEIANSLWGANRGLSTDGTAQAVLDTAQKASGNSSLKFTIPISSGPNNSGNYWLNFSDDLRTVFPCHGESYAGTTCVQAGTGNDYYVQFRARFDPYYITNQYSGGGWKLAWVGNVGDHPGCNTSNTTNCFPSCTDLEQVLQNTFHYNVGVLGYYGCPGTPYEASYYTNTPNPGDINLQSGMPSPYCLYPPATAQNCFRWFGNEWMTFQAHLHVDNPRTFAGTGAECAVGVLCRDYPSSYIEVWAAREGQPSQLVITKAFPIFARDNALDQRYGKIWLTAYDSGRVPGSGDATQVSYVWFDEVIISTVKIADPGAGGGPGSPSSVKLTRRIQ